ncbi:MAG: MarR family transcriptional regulator [Pseudomonadota bacterium]
MADLLTLSEIVARDPSMPDLTIRQYAVLNVLTQYRSVDFGVVCKRLGLSKPVLTRAITAFEASGWLDRSNDATDQRKRVLQLTSVGRDLAQRLRLAGSKSFNG